MAEYRSGAEREHRCHPSPFIAEAAMSDREHAAVNAVQASGLDSARSTSLANPRALELPE
jgi:hypothetical protein